MPQPSRWLIYALGGGFGHLTRACALARAALPDVEVRILTNSPFAARVAHAFPELDLILLDPSMDAGEARAEVVRRITSSAAECLIVDTFPRGLGGELAAVISVFPGLKVFVQRDLNPLYVTAYDLNRFVESSYHLVLQPGDTAPGSLGPFPQSLATAPWLIRSGPEMMQRVQARQVLGLRRERPCIVVCAAGNPGELAWYGDVVSEVLKCAPECDVRCISPLRPAACPPECWLAYWPAMDLYAAADVVIGGAGYNTIYECVACGIPLVARAWPRKYDRQSLRAGRAAGQAGIRIVDDLRSAVAAAADLLKTPHPLCRVFDFPNGAPAAAEQIRQMLHRITRQDIHRM